MMFFFFFFDEQGNPVKKSYKSVSWDKAEKNKGEWSELYTLFKLLADQNLYPIEKSQIDGERLRLPILSIMRYIDQEIGVEYLITEDSNINMNINNEEQRVVEKSEFSYWAKQLFAEISSVKKKDASFAIPSLNDFRDKTCCPKVACVNRKIADNCKDKSDLYIVIHDTLTGQTPKQGFSIKSEIGSAPTLVNASLLTNFHYRLTKPLTQAQVDLVNNMNVKHGTKFITDVTGRLAKIKELGSELRFCGIRQNKNNEDVFLENLILVDSFMPQILAWLLYTSFSTGERRIDKLTEMITKANPMGFPMTVNTKHYEAKVKRLLMDFALGMLPSQPWEATDLASGVLVVKPSGNIDCYHVLYKDTLEEYLYHDLKFETASATRHDFASIKTDSHGNQYFTLNLQLRFIH